MGPSYSKHRAAHAPPLRRGTPAVQAAAAALLTHFGVAREAELREGNREAKLLHSQHW